MARLLPSRPTLWWLLPVLWQASLSHAQSRTQCQSFHTEFVDTAKACRKSYTNWNMRYYCLMQNNLLPNLIACVADEGSSRLDNKLCQDSGSLDEIPDKGTKGYYPSSEEGKFCVSPRKVVLNGAANYCNYCAITGYIKACPFEPETEEFLTCLCGQGLEYDDFNCLSDCFGFGKETLGPIFPLNKRNGGKWCPLWDDKGRQPWWNRRVPFGGRKDDSLEPDPVHKRAQPPRYQLWEWGDAVIAWDNTTDLMYPCNFDPDQPKKCKLRYSLPYVDSHHDARNQRLRRCIVHPSEPSQACWSVDYTGTGTVTATPTSTATSTSQLAKYADVSTAASFTPPTTAPTTIEQQATFTPKLSPSSTTSSRGASLGPRWALGYAMVVIGALWLV